jgi:hypothetical protein
MLKNNITLEFKISQDENDLGRIEDYKHITTKKINKIMIYLSELLINKIQYNINIHGILCKDNIDTLIVTMEHEITHLILFIELLKQIKYIKMKKK